MQPALQKLLSFAACVFAGWIAAFAMPPHSLWPLMFAGLSALYYFYSRTATAAQAFGTGFFFALGYFVTGLWWIGNALLVEGNEFAWVWPISVVGLPTLLALFTGTYLAIARLLAPPTSLHGFFAFAFFLTFSEWARGNAFTGFPWNLYGYVWADHLPMAQAAHFVGAYGLTFISVVWAASPLFLLKWPATTRKRFAGLVLLVASLAATFALGRYRLANHPTELDDKTGVVVVQPNIAQVMKWDPAALQENFETGLRLSANASFDGGPVENIFIVWPETAISPSVYSSEANMAAIRTMLAGYRNANSFFVTGVLRREQKPDGDLAYGNSIVYLNENLEALGVYDKTHLVPFGEFIPLQNWIPLKPVAAFKGFERGHGATTFPSSGARAFTPLICYEVIFADQVTPKTGPRPSWIVNVTNDGWYGDSAGPYQHFAQTRLRAIEEGIPVVRSANTGISGVIDSYGRVVAKADIFEQTALAVRLPTALPNKNPWWPWAVQILLPLIAIPLMWRAYALNKN